MRPPRVKVRIPLFARTWAKGSTMREVFLTIVATTISIILTFGTAALLDRCQRANDRKMSAMMVMSNIEQFSRNVEDMSQKIARCDSIGAWMRSLPQDKLDNIPPEEVGDLINEVLALVDVITHDKTAENIFSNNIETWKNMGNFQFIDNVGACFSKMNAEETNWSQWVNEYEACISQVLSQMKPGEHTLTKLLTNNVFRQKIEDFHVRKYWLDYVAANIRYYNRKNMALIGISEDEVMAFTDQRTQDINIDGEQPIQSDFRTDTLTLKDLNTLRPIIQHIDSVMNGK